MVQKNFNPTINTNFLKYIAPICRNTRPADC
jgi:hypothetical protein